MDKPRRIAGFFGELSGPKRYGLLMVCGGLASLSLPPANFSIILFVTFPVLVLVLDGIDAEPVRAGKKRRAGFASGWWFGFGYFIVSLYWIGAAFLVEPDKFALLLPLGVAALPAGLSLFWGGACAVAIMFWRPGWSRILLLALCFAGAEWLRGNILTGFPWNLIGFASLGLGGVSQLAAFSGIYGVTLAMLIWAFSPALLVGREKNHRVLALSLITIVAVWVGGSLRIAPVADATNRPMIRVVQPNISQNKKWARTYRNENISRYFRLSPTGRGGLRDGLKNIDILVWPESAFPAFYEESPVLKKLVADMLPDKTLLIMGAIRREKQPGGATQNYKSFNSVLAINRTGEVTAAYDKAHLVPFGEYLPAESWLKLLGVRKLVAIPGNFSSGPGSRTITVAGYPAFAPLICYEIAFPGAGVDKRKRPEWIANVTNDGWFGHTAGPYQHLAQAQLRAIEEGLPVVRAANTGISAVIDPFGRVIASLKLGQQGVVDARLPASLPQTFFSRYGNLVFLAEFISMLIMLSASSFRLRNRRTLKE
jgi:apolipoprotein N-acyltransferase